MASVCSNSSSCRQMDWLKVCLLLACVTLLLAGQGDATPQGDALYAMMQKWQAAFPSWTAGGDPCGAGTGAWEGITCDSSNLNVISLNLTNRGLVGPIPPQIAQLPSLLVLDLSNYVDITITGNLGWNAITGPWPQELAKLTSLQTLYLTFNPLDTTFPDVVLGLTSLVNLKLDNANLVGQIPSGIGNLRNLEILYLGNNSLTGPIPLELTTLSNLTELTMWNNSFNSQIPSGIGKLTKLTYLNLHTCDLYGGLPSSFGSLVNLQKLTLQTNSLTGPIPDSWQSLTSLSVLQMFKNSLSGDLPTWLFNLPSLVQIDLYNNEFQGPFPKFDLQKYKRLNLKCNFLTGPYPTYGQEDGMLGYKENCFDNVTEAEDDSPAKCQRSLNCRTFLSLTKGGSSCAPCPPHQIPLASGCVCTPGEPKTNAAATNGPPSTQRLALAIGLALAVTGFPFLS